MTTNNSNYTATENNIDKLYDIIYEKRIHYEIFFNQLNIHSKTDTTYREIIQKILTENNITNYLKFEKKLFEAMFEKIEENEKEWHEMFIKCRIADDVDNTGDY